MTKMEQAGVPTKIRTRVDWAFVHPKVRQSFIVLAHRLIEAHENKHLSQLYLPFEGYRNPMEQVSLRQRGVSKAGPWQSAHNYGLAVDYVGWNLKDGWNWQPADHDDWKMVGTIANNLGLMRPIRWDKPHVEHPIWTAVKSKLI